MNGNMLINEKKYYFINNENYNVIKDSNLFLICSEDI